MKNTRKVISEKWFKVGEHKALCIRKLEEFGKVRFEVEQLLSDEIIPEDGKGHAIRGSNFRCGMDIPEFNALIKTGVEYMIEIYKEKK